VLVIAIAVSDVQSGVELVGVDRLARFHFHVTLDDDRIDALEAGDLDRIDGLRRALRGELDLLRPRGIGGVADRQ